MADKPRKAKRIVIQQVPKPAPRARCRCLPGYSAGRPYSPADYRKWTDMVAQDISNRPLGEPFDGPVMIWMRFAVPKPKTTKLSHPKPDIDNYEKALFDALTKAGNVWDDDHQIVKILESSKVWTEQPNGGIVVSVMPLGEFDVPSC